MKSKNLKQLLERRIFAVSWQVSLIAVLFSVSVFFATCDSTIAAFARSNHEDHHKGNPNSPLCSDGIAQCPEGTFPKCMGNDAMSIVTCSSNEERSKCCDTHGRCDSERIVCVPNKCPVKTLPPDLVFYVDAMNIDGSGVNFADPTDTTTDWDDLSSHANDGELINFTLPANTNSGWDGENKVCNPSVLKFDGADDFVTVGKPNILNISGSETFSAWVKFTDPVMFSYIFGDFDPSGIFTQGSIRVGNTGSAIGYQQEHTDGSTLSFDGSTNLLSNTWYNIVFVRDDGAKTVRLYLDGQPYGTAQSYSGKTVISDNDSGNKTIGRAGSFDGNYTNGSIANVRIFNTALTAGEVNQKFLAETNSFQNPTPACPVND